MNRREFFKLLLSMAFLALFGKNVNAKEKSEKPLKEAMFWRRLD